MVVLALASVVAIGALAANAGRYRLQDEVAPSQTPERVEVLQGESGDAERTAAALEDAKRNAPIEAAQAAESTPEALYEAAVTGGGPAHDGSFALDAAVGQSPWQRLDSMLLIQTREMPEVSYEGLTYGDGTGYLSIFWQRLSGNGDPQALVGEHGKVELDGTFDVVTDSRDLPGSILRIVRVYDGVRVLSIMANNIKGLEIDEIKDIAIKLFSHLPAS